MGFSRASIGKYQFSWTIGEGTFAKVKLAVDTISGQHVAIKIIEKQMVLQCDLKCQVQREIRTMKLLHHPNIVRIYEVIGTKTKIYVVMEYVSGGQLFEKLSSIKKLEEEEARKLFQQLIDVVDYCHSKGVYHRDLKPENLLLDSEGNLKVSDFGLSALQKPGSLLATACGSPCYVAPELLTGKGYDGAAADIWSCGVILFEMLAGYLPFNDSNFTNLYRKISAGDYTFPPWITPSQAKLLSRILEPDPNKRATVAEILEDAWFQTKYKPSCPYVCDEKTYTDDVTAAFSTTEENTMETKMRKSSSFINAFQLIAMSSHLNLSGLFTGEDEAQQKVSFGSKHCLDETISKIEAAATDMRLTVEKTDKHKVKLHSKEKIKRCKTYYDLSAEVIEVAPTHCVVEISKSAAELGIYNKFCKSLSSLLTQDSEIYSRIQEAREVNSK